MHTLCMYTTLTVLPTGTTFYCISKGVLQPIFAMIIVFNKYSKWEFGFNMAYMNLYDTRFKPNSTNTVIQEIFQLKFLYDTFLG